MYLIKSCISCGEKIRFPIDKGKIKVTCKCGSSFFADPDDPALYRGASFDLKEKSGRRKMSPSMKGYQFSIKEIVDILISRFLSVKYKLQNFPILPAREQRNITLIALAIVILLAFIIYVIIQLTTSDKQPGMIVLHV